MIIPSDWSYDFEIDGGDLSCSSLILELKQYFNPLPAGCKVLVIALDSGAVIDIPAWCWSTGHELVEKQHPLYLIQRRANS